jgi:hypothetical protein
MAGRKQRQREYVERVSERLRMLDRLKPLAHADAGEVTTRIMNLNYGRRSPR